MITAVDTSVLLDIFAADRVFGTRSREALRRAVAEGSLIACPVVWAEVAAGFQSAQQALQAMQQLGVSFSPIGLEAALGAADVWHRYRRGGGTRQRLIADFLIGAHACALADRLLTRDRGFYRSYFNALQILDPAPPGG
jgi:predicted nucleic acid-binding protein